MVLDPFAGTRPPEEQGLDPFAGTRAQQPTQQSQPSEDDDYKLSLSDPKKWDWKTAEFGMHGEKLPDNAKSWTPYGQPYFGQGLMGKLKEYAWSFTKDVEAPDSEDWNTIKDKWRDLNERAGDFGSDTEQEQRSAASKEVVGLAAETVSTWWKGLEASKLSPLSYVSRGVSTGLKVVGDVFSQGGKAVKHSLSAFQELREFSNEVSAPIPRLDQNNFTRTVENTPIGAVYDITRVALSPDNGGWDGVLDRIKQGWNAGRIYYSGLLDQTMREEYIRRYQAGENPDLLAMEMSNRTVDVWGHEVNANLIEMGGELIFDPLNFVGAFAKSGKVTSEINKAQNLGGMLTKPGVEDALQVIIKGADESKTYDAWKTVVAAHAEAVNDVQNGKLLKQGWGITDLTVSSREGALSSKAADFIGFAAGGMMREGFSKDEVLEALKYGIKSISKDAEEMQMGLAGLAKLPNAAYFTGDDAITTFSTIRKMLQNEEGILNFSRLDKLFTKTGNMSEFVDEAVKLVEHAASNQFAKISEMEDAVKAIKTANKTGAEVSQTTKDLAKLYESVPAHAKLASRVNESFLGQARQWTNNTLGTFYFNAQGGVAAKNILSNSVLVGIDKGLDAFAGVDEIVQAGKVITKPQIWSKGAIENNMKAWFGDMQLSATSGFDTLVSSQSGKGEAVSFASFVAKGLQQYAEHDGEAKRLLALFRTAYARDRDLYR
jgi:hypothetical protein